MRFARASILCCLIACFFCPAASAITPRPMKATMIKVAPDQCLFFFHSAGFTTPDGSSSNKTEQLFADTDIRRFIDEAMRLADQAVEVAIKDGQLSDEDAEQARQFYGLARKLIAQPVTFYISELDIEAKQIEAGFVIDGGEHAEELKTAMKAVMAEADDAEISTVEVSGVKSYFVSPKDQDDPPVYWTMTGTSLVVTVGNDSLERLLGRLKTPPPAWIKAVVDRLPVARRSMISYLNAKELARLVATAPDPEPAKAWEALGWTEIESASIVAGLDDEGSVTRALISCNQLKGMMEIFDNPGLPKDELAVVPGAATFAAAIQMDPAKVLAAVERMVAEMDPDAAQEMQANIAQSQQMLGFDPRADLIDALGDRWTIYQSGTGMMMMPELVASVNLRDQSRFQGALEKIVGIAQQMMAAQQQGAVSIEETTIGETPGYLVQGLPIAPAWCIAGDKLLVSTSTGSLKSHLDRVSSEGDSMAAQPRIAELFGQGNPSAVGFSDLKADLERSYPMLQMFLNMGVGQMKQQTGMEFDLGTLPPLESITKYLEPSIFSMRRADDGLEFKAHETLPQVSVSAVGAPVAVALLLPAVQAARAAARRVQSTNNLRQIGLALLNYESANTQLPSAEKNGLSWRVHILPFMEEQALYDEFKLDEPWDSDHNKQLISRMPLSFQSPSSTNEETAGLTNYLAIRSDSAMIVDGPQGLRLREITDGLSNTIMAVEVNDDRAVVWTKPDDFDYDPAAPANGLGSMQPGEIFLALFGDSHVSEIPITTSNADLAAMYTRNGGETVTAP